MCALINISSLVFSCLVFDTGLAELSVVMLSVQRLIESMNNGNLDVIAFPTWSNPPKLIGNTFGPDGGSQFSERKAVPDWVPFWQC